MIHDHEKTKGKHTKKRNNKYTRSVQKTIPIRFTVVSIQPRATSLLLILLLRDTLRAFGDIPRMMTKPQTLQNDTAALVCTDDPHQLQLQTTVIVSTVEMHFFSQ